jgi:hypothetical protein
MSSKSSVPQAARSDSHALMSDSCTECHVSHVPWVRILSPGVLTKKLSDPNGNDRKIETRRCSDSFRRKPASSGL